MGFSWVNFDELNKVDCSIVDNGFDSDLGASGIDTGTGFGGNGNDIDVGIAEVSFIATEAISGLVGNSISSSIGFNWDSNWS